MSTKVAINVGLLVYGDVNKDLNLKAKGHESPSQGHDSTNTAMKAKVTTFSLQGQEQILSITSRPGRHKRNKKDGYRQRNVRQFLQSA